MTMIFRISVYAASVLRTDEKTVGGRDRFFTWLKAIFNKSAEDKSHKADTVIVDRAATATTFDRPEIAASTRPADSSDKVDVINQKVANFCAVQPTTKLEYGNIRAEERDAENGERAIQQSAIYAGPSRFAAGKTSEHEGDPDSSWRDPGKMYRSERNGGAIEFAARDNLDAAWHYRCYTSPRHCYRLPPQRTKQPLLGLYVPNRYINVPMRAIAGFTPRNTKPPIKEPNAPEKREKDEKKDKKEKKKPVVRTDSESADSSENRAEMVADDNPKRDPNVMFRYEWGVKLAEEQLAAEVAKDNDKFVEKGEQYVTKRLWGVNLKQPKSRSAPLVTVNSKGGEDKPQNVFSIFESDDTTAGGAKSGAGAAPNDPMEKSDASSLKGTTAEYLSNPSWQTGSSDDLIATQQDSGDASSYMSSEELRKIMRTSPNILKETIIDNEYNIPEGAGLDTEITAWRSLIMKLNLKKENYLSTDSVETISILPEAPQPKLDVQVVKSIQDNLKDEETEQSDSGDTSPKFVEIKRVGSPRGPDSYSIDRKLHTMSTQIRHVRQRMNSVSRQRIDSLSSNFASINRSKMKCPGSMSAFSTTPEDSPLKKVFDGKSNQESKQRMDLKSQNKSNPNDPNSNDRLSGESLSLAEARMLSSSDRKQVDADFAKTLDIIADKEMEFSLQTNQLQNTENKSRYKDEDVQDTVKRCEKLYSNYVNESAAYANFNLPTDSGPNKSDAIKLVKGNSRAKDNLIFDSSVKDVNDDSSKKYIVDGDYVRLPGDPYPYNRENLNKWHVPHSRNVVYNPWKREMSYSSDFPTVARSILKNANDAYVNAAGKPRDSHAGNTVMETSGSDGGARKRTGQTDGFYVSSRDQRVVSDCLRGDAADALGLRQWTEAFSRLDIGEKINEAVRSGDNARYD